MHMHFQFGVNKATRKVKYFFDFIESICIFAISRSST